MLPIFTTQSETAGRAETDAAIGKVELDLEGAPFLEPDVVEKPQDGGSAKFSAKAATPLDSAVKQPVKKSKKKLIILFGALVLGLLLISLGAVYLIFLREPSRKIPEDGEYEVVVVPSTPPSLPPAAIDRFNISWEPFWVEVADPEGEIRFVYCKIMLVTDNQRIALQVTNKITVIRDAVYYYIRHKPYSFLADLRQLDVLKAELLNIINYYIIPETIIPRDLPPGEAPPPNAPTERLKEILIEEYLIK